MPFYFTRSPDHPIPPLPPYFQRSGATLEIHLHPDASAGTIGFVFRLPHTQVPAPALAAGISEQSPLDFEPGRAGTLR